MSRTAEIDASSVGEGRATAGSRGPPTALGLDLRAGYDPDDPVTARSVGQVPVDGYAAAADGGRLDGVRVGLVTGGLAIWGDQPDGPVVVLREAAADLEELGAEVVPVTAPPPALLGSPPVIGPESSRDATAFLQALGPDAPVSSFRELYDSGAYTPSTARSPSTASTCTPTSATSAPSPAGSGWRTGRSTRWLGPTSTPWPTRPPPSSRTSSGPSRRASSAAEARTPASRRWPCR